jgi:7,8-dihydroneopterin aldolase/epimerase/oxygenase
MSRILIEDMEFYAYHGCFKEEQVAGNRFLIGLTLQCDSAVAEKTDNIADALNYQTAYFVVKKEMEKKSHLLENVGARILTALFEKFPQLEQATIKVSKMTPPMGGPMRCVSVELERKR